MFSKYKLIFKASSIAFRPTTFRRPECNQVYQFARLFASNQSKGGGRGTGKPPGAMSTGDECKTARIMKPSSQCRPDKTSSSDLKDDTNKDCYPFNKSSIEKVIPSEQEFAKPNLMKDSADPDCPWDDEKKGKKGGQSNPPWFLLGLAALAAALYALYAMGIFDGNEGQGGSGSGTGSGAGAGAGAGSGAGSDKSGSSKSGSDNKDSSFWRKKSKKKKSWEPKTIIKNPATSADIPSEIPYLLIGGGTASFSAFRSIKSLDPSAKVLVISAESDYPYMRPPLSKEIWYNDDKEATKNLRFKQWNGTERSVFYEPDDFYSDCKTLKDRANGGVAVARGWTVCKLDVNEKKAILDDGHVISYEKCLIATGSNPNNLPVFETADEEVQDKISLYREIYDFQGLDHVINGGAKDIAIVGGGFLGSELACSLARKGKKGGFTVHQVFRESGNMGKVLPEYLSDWTSKKVIEEGVHVIAKTNVDKVDLEDDMVVLKLSNGEKIKAAHVVIAVGASPNTNLAKSSGLEVDAELGGYLVNAELMARSRLWVAGDCATFFDPRFGRRRVEHHDHAVVSGRLAGENMTGAGKAYSHQSMFWSDLGPNVGYEAIGIVDSTLPTVGVFAKATENDTPKAVVTATDQSDRAESEASAQPVVPSKSSQSAQEGDEFGKGVIFYLRDDIVVGIVLWNVFNRMSVARQVLQDECVYEDLNEVAKLFNIHED